MNIDQRIESAQSRINAYIDKMCDSAEMGWRYLELRGIDEIIQMTITRECEIFVSAEDVEEWDNGKDSEWLKWEL